MLIQKIANLKQVKNYYHERKDTTISARGIAKLIDGKAVADTIKEELIQRVSALPKKPVLNIIQVGDRQDSNSYVRMKQKTASEIGITCNVHKLPAETTQHDLEMLIEKFNDDDSHGLLVQLPFPPHLSNRIVEKVCPEKDVDGFHPLNVGALVSRSDPLFIPCTPKACIELLLRSGVEIKGKNAVVIGRSLVVGTPVFHLLTHHDATVTLCHSKTPDIASIVKRADIVIVAIGKARFVQPEWIKEGAVVIDVGINQDPNVEGTRKLVGDVDEGVRHVAGQLTPVPGGVGPMTVMMLMSNLVESAERAMKERRAIKILPLNLLEPVPKDYEISSAQRPKPIVEIAKEVGIKSSELSPYGRNKAKVSN